MQGQRFGRLVVLARVPPNRWRCRCDCGEERSIGTSALTRGLQRSCGCLRRELVAEKNRTHGHRHTPEYQSWAAMKQRCSNPAGKRAVRYVGRGISVCAAWAESFEAFLADMGPKPSPHHSLDRIDNDGPYSPENCRWATHEQQARNRSGRACYLTHNGVTKQLCEWAEETGQPWRRLYYRWKQGWEPERLLHQSPNAR